jgi:hypothetical protein
MPVVNPEVSFAANVPSKGDKKASNADVPASLIDLRRGARPRRAARGSVESTVRSFQAKKQPHRGAAVFVEGEFVRRP